LELWLDREHDDKEKHLGCWTLKLGDAFKKLWD